MVAEDRFAWHEAARLFAGEQEIARAAERPSGDGFRALAASPARDALPALAQALGASAPFALSDHPLPESLNCPPGYFLTLTGGASGHPKAVRRSQASWIASFLVNAERFGLSPSDSVAVLGQLSHSLSLYAVLEGLHLGLDAHVLAGHPPRAQAARMVEVGATLLYATPTQLRLLARAAKSELPSVRLVVCGGGALDGAIRAAVRTLCPQATVYEFYGAAETSFITLSGEATPAGSVGQPYPGVMLRLLDDAGRETSGPGEVWVKSPYLFDGYALGDSADTRWRDGFVTVGEMGELDAAGNLWIRGRRKRMVQIADQMVFPEAVEAVITAQGYVCVVLPRNDALRGQHLVAVIEGKADPVEKAAILSACRAELGALVSPRELLFHPELPLLPSGKTDLRALSVWLEGQS